MRKSTFRERIVKAAGGGWKNVEANEREKGRPLVGKRQPHRELVYCSHGLLRAGDHEDPLRNSKSCRDRGFLYVCSPPAKQEGNIAESSLCSSASFKGKGGKGKPGDNCLIRGPAFRKEPETSTHACEVNSSGRFCIFDGPRSTVKTSRAATK